MSTHETDLVILYQAKVMGLRQAEAVIGNLPQKPLLPEDKWVSVKMFVLTASGLPHFEGEEQLQ